MFRELYCTDLLYVCLIPERTVHVLGCFVDGTAFRICSVHIGAVFVDGKDKEAMLVFISDSSSELRALHIH